MSLMFLICLILLIYWQIRVWRSCCERSCCRNQTPPGGQTSLGQKSFSTLADDYSQLTPHPSTAPNCNTSAAATGRCATPTWGGAGRWRLTEARRPSVSRCPAHTGPFRCTFLPLHWQPGRFLPDTQKGLQSASHSSLHKGLQSHNSIMSKSGGGVLTGG